eukprot:1146112-Pelagomonas_calceolata.AAC.2
MLGCLALRTGSLLMLTFHQRASGMSCTESVSQVGLFSFRWILAAVFQTAMIRRLQEWRGSTISLPTKKEGVA